MLEWRNLGLAIGSKCLAQPGIIGWPTGSGRMNKMATTILKTADVATRQVAYPAHLAVVPTHVRPRPPAGAAQRFSPPDKRDDACLWVTKDAAYLRHWPETGEPVCIQKTFAFF